PARNWHDRWASASSAADAPSKRIPSGRNRESRTRVGLDALDHGLESVRALRREMLAQAELVEQRDGIAVENFACCLPRVEGEQDRDQPAHDVGVAVAREGQDWTTGAVRLDAGRKPHLAGAALHLVGVTARSFRQRLEFAPELDHIAITVVPVVEDGEIVDDF